MLTALVKRSKPLPSNSKLLILGGGFSGQRIAALTKALGNNVLCTRREASKPGADIIFDSRTQQLPPKEALEGVTHLVSCIPPSEDGTDPVITNLIEHLKVMPLEWVGYLSTTGVYGDSKGDWVTEKDHPRPTLLRSKRRLACEEAWKATGLPLQILRLPGIYGPGRSVLQSVLNGNSKMIDKPGQVFSRIHLDDIACATLHLIHQAKIGQRPTVINVADDIPIANTEVIRYASKLLGRSLPPVEPFESAATKMSPMALSFWQENRRISNKLLCKDLGYTLIHPDYQSGLKDCLLKDGL